MTAHQEDTVDVALGERTVPVPGGGLYDTYRMRTDLNAVAQDPRVAGVEFFRDQPKTEVSSPIGPTWTPNFYYAMSSARLTMLAPTRSLRPRLPEELDPLEIAPGFGLASLMLFRYDRTVGGSRRSSRSRSWPGRPTTPCGTLPGCGVVVAPPRAHHKTPEKGTR